MKHPRLVRHVLRFPAVFRLGWREAHGDGRTYDDDAWSPRSLAYDTGRDLRRWGRA
jgi:hypothetical protein